MDYRNIINQIRYHPWLTTVLVAMIVGSNAWTIVGQMDIPDKELDYWGIAVYAKYNCDPYQIHLEPWLIQRNILKYYLHCTSFYYTHSIKTFPLIFNIGLMPLVYLLGYRLTNDRLIGLVALVAFINNPLYRDWWANGTYDNIWSFFLLLSVLLFSRNIRSSSVIAYMLSAVSKGVSFLYFPAWIYTMYQERKSKSEIVMVVGCLALLGWLVSFWYNPVGNQVGFFPERWEDALYRNISVLWQVIPFLALFVVLSRNFIPKIKVPNEKIVWVWMLCAILQNPIVYFFTLQDTYSYRYAPLAAFFSIFIGMTLVNMGNWIQERQLAKASAL